MKSRWRDQLATWGSAIGVVVTALSCTVMIAATVVGLLGVIGLRVSAQFADAFNTALAPIAQPLLVVALALIVIGLVPRGRLPILLALIGGVLVFVSMFLIPGGGSGMSRMAAMSTTQTNPFSLLVFWLGMAGLALAFIVAYRH